MRRPFLLFTFLFFIFCFLTPVPASATTREEVISRYEEAVSLVEITGPSVRNPQGIKERMDAVHAAIEQNDYENANNLLNALILELEKSRADGRTLLNKEQRLQWLELYLDLFQKFAILALLAFLLMQNSSWRMALRTGKLPVMSRIIWVVFAVVLGGTIRVLDLSRYGDSVWAVFDVQVVFAVLAGMLGGVVWGLAGGIFMAILRFVSLPGVIAAPLVILAASVIGVVFTFGMKDYVSSGKRGFYCGAGAGLVHGAVVYFPAAGMLAPAGLILSIGLLTLFEATATGIFFSVISAVLQSDLKKDTENRLLKTRLLLLQSQLRPHFLFNTLNTIAAVCGNGDAGLGEHLVLKLSEFLRHTFDRKEDSVSLEKEMAFVNAYLEIESARFGTKLKITKDLRVNDNGWKTKVPILVLQPLVENAVKHGISKKPEGGTVAISIEEKPEGLWCSVSDDGPGRGTDYFEELFRGKVEADGVGIGVRNIQERLVRLYGREYGLKYESAPGKGTKVSFVVPGNEKEKGS